MLSESSPLGITTILVPIDFSARSEAGIRYGAMLARRFGASLTVMTCVERPHNVGIGLDLNARIQHSVAEAMVGLRNTVEPIVDDVSVDFDVQVCTDPAAGVLQSAEETHACMIAMSSHGRSGMTRWLLGSVAERVVRASDVPVLIVPTREAVATVSDSEKSMAVAGVV